MNQEQKFEISLDTLNKVGGYLSTRPYNEVAQLIALLSQLKPIVEAKGE
jgi:hypothetical protein